MTATKIVQKFWKLKSDIIKTSWNQKFYYTVEKHFRNPWKTGSAHLLKAREGQLVPTCAWVRVEKTISDELQRLSVCLCVAIAAIAATLQNSTKSTHSAYAPLYSAYLHYCRYRRCFVGCVGLSRRHGCQKVCVYVNLKAKNQLQTPLDGWANTTVAIFTFGSGFPRSRRGCRLFSRPTDKPWHTEVLRKTRIAKVVPVETKKKKQTKS